jgi:hypothetical protein
VVCGVGGVAFGVVGVVFGLGSRVLYVLPIALGGAAILLGMRARRKGPTGGGGRRSLATFALAVGAIAIALGVAGVVKDDNSGSEFDEQELQLP